MKEIKKRLEGMIFPCVMVVYGAERTHRTTYRGENPGYFWIGYIDSLNDAAKTIYDSDAKMPLSELSIYGIHSGNENGPSVQLDQI